jgi:hypothetical protein
MSRTRSLQPTAAAVSVFGGRGRFAALRLRRSMAPRRLWLREVVKRLAGLHKNEPFGVYEV